MTEHSISRQGSMGEIEQIGRDTYRVQSFSDPSVFYEVHLKDLSCECPAHQYGHVTPCKHIIEADAVSAISAGVGFSVAVERVTDLCRRIFVRKSSIVESYRTLNDVLYSPHASEAMRVAAIKRHAGRVARAA